MPSSSTSDAARRLVGLERLGLAAAAVQREHQLAAQVLAQRVLSHQRLELADELGVAAEREVGLDARARAPPRAAPPGGAISARANGS